MKKCGRKIAASLAALAMIFAFATCSIGDDIVDDPSKNGQGVNGECGESHTWNAGEVTKAPTETVDGEKKFTCTVCGITKTEAIPALGHSHTVASEWTFDEAHHWHEASSGKEEHRTDISAHAWNAGEVTKAPTENYDGEKKFTCTVCGYTKTEAIPALGHEHTVASEWTFDEDFHWHEASCGKAEHRTDKSAHEWNEGVVTTAPTCTAEGERTYTCTVCGKTKTEPVAASGHTWNEGEVTKSATETDDGEKKFTCTACEETRTEAIPALGHEHTVTSEWTFDETHHWHEASCKREEHRTDKTEHVWDTGEVTTAPTCTAEGERTYTCTVCGKTRTETIAKSKHANMTVTLTDEGERKETCTTCGYETASAWTKETLSGLYDALKNYRYKNAKVKVVGELPDTYEIAAAFFELFLLDLSFTPSKLVDLDLSGTTGLTTISFKDPSMPATKFCTSLVSIQLPSYITEIGDYAFSGCQNLASITIPESVTKIGKYAFDHCYKLTTSIKIPDGMTEIGESTFDCCESITSITIPDSVTKIGDSAFHNCRALKSIKLPNSLTTIGREAFDNCQVLTLESTTIPSSVTKIGYSAFAHCKEFTKVTLPEGLTEIDDMVFDSCIQLCSVKIPSSVTRIGKWAFADTRLYGVPALPEGLIEIGERAFANLRDRPAVKDALVIPSTVTKIGPRAFYYDGYLLDNGIKFKNTSNWRYYIDESHTFTYYCDVGDDTKLNAKNLVYRPDLPGESYETEHPWSKYGMERW